jgi:hypothetical protein
MVIENSASFYAEPSTDGPEFAPFSDKYLDSRSLRYGGQCYADNWTEFKRGAIALYDALSQNSTFRVAVMTAETRTGEPHLLADFGETTITASKLEFDLDQPDNHSTRCAALAKNGSFPVPLNTNVADGVWTPRTELNGLVDSNFDMVDTTPLLTREAIWILPAGYSMANGHIAPQHYASGSKLDTLRLTADMLSNSRRADSIPVGQREILLLTDDAGMAYDSTNGFAISSTTGICNNWESAVITSGVQWGILFFGHNLGLPAHDYTTGTNGTDVQNMRTSCFLDRGFSNGIFFSETSPRTVSSLSAFSSKTAPLVAQGLKQVQLLK